MQAIDSCIAVSMRANLVDDAFLYTLYNRIEFLLHIGDFDRCYDYAGNGEHLARKSADKQKAAYYLLYFPDCMKSWLKCWRKRAILPAPIFILRKRSICSMKLEHAATGSKLVWREIFQCLYEHAIEACLAKNDMMEAMFGRV